MSPAGVEMARPRKKPPVRNRSLDSLDAFLKRLALDTKLWDAFLAGNRPIVSSRVHLDCPTCGNPMQRQGLGAECIYCGEFVEYGDL